MKMKNELFRRIMMTLSGIFLAGISVGMFNFSAFGMDPFQVFAHGLSYKTPLSYGLFYMLLNMVILIFILILDRKKIGLGTVFNMFLVGYIVEFSSNFFSALIIEPSFLMRWLFFAMAIIVMCFGSSLYFTANLGVSTYDAIALIMAERTPIKFQYCRIGGDLVCTIIGVLFGAVVGVGTVATAFFMGPIIAFFNYKIAIPLRYGKGYELSFVE